MPQIGQEVKPLTCTIPEAIKILGCSETKLRAEIKTGELKAFQIGTIWHIRLTAIDDYIQRQEEKAALMLSGRGPSSHLADLIKRGPRLRQGSGVEVSA